MEAPTNFAVVDFETTGLFPGAHDRAVEVAVIRTDSVGSPICEYTTLINPERDLGASHVHRITSDLVIHAPLFRDIVGDVVELIRGAVFVAHNVHFDKRFFEAESRRAAYTLPNFPTLCTMQLARRVAPDAPSRKLEALCSYFDIRLVGAHSALADARAAAALLKCCLSRLATTTPLSIESIGVRGWATKGQDWPSAVPSGKALQRTKAVKIAKYSQSRISKLVSRLPAMPDASVEFDGYMALLDRVLEDRIVTVHEIEQLQGLAAELGLGREQVQDAHRQYMSDLIQAAWEDGILTELEKRDLELVRRALGITVDEMQRMIAAKKNEAISQPPSCAPDPEPEELRGKTICFTGQLAAIIEGTEATRKYAEETARARGMTVSPRCTKQLDFLVVADPNSMSGKAKQARKFGVRIIAEPVFWRMMGIAAC